MQNNTIFTQEYENNHLAHPGLTDPTDVLLKTIDEINDIFYRLNEMYDVTYEDFQSFYQTTDLKYYQYLEKLWSSVDSDIYAKYLSYDLMNYEYRRWKENLKKWQSEMIQAVKQFVWTELGQNFIPDVKKQHMIEAA